MDFKYDHFHTSVRSWYRMVTRHSQRRHICWNQTFKGKDRVLGRAIKRSCKFYYKLDLKKGCYE